VQEAKGGLKLGLKRAAAWLLKFEHPDEALLRAAARAGGGGGTLELLHVGGPLGQRRARRHLRLLARGRADAHRKGLLAWGASLPILGPLAILPLPNVPAYWAAYRTYANWNAARGAATLKAALAAADAADAAARGRRGGDGAPASTAPAVPAPAAPAAGAAPPRLAWREDAGLAALLAAAGGALDDAGVAARVGAAAGVPADELAALLARAQARAAKRKRGV